MITDRVGISLYLWGATFQVWILFLKLVLFGHIIPTYEIYFFLHRTNVVLPTEESEEILLQSLHF